MSRMFLILVSRRSRFYSAGSSWSSNWSRLDWSHLQQYDRSIFIRWESIIPVNSWILLSESAWNSCFWISVLTSARICSFVSFKENPDSFVFHVATWFSFLVRTRFVYGSPRTCVRKRTGLATNFLHENDKLVSGLLVLLAPEWTVVKIVLFR